MRDSANVYLRIEINRSTYPCLLDSGCEYTMMPQAIVEKSGAEVTPVNIVVYVANGTPLMVDGKAVVEMKLNGQRISTKTLVTPDVEEIMMVRTGWKHRSVCGTSKRDTLL